MTHHMIQPWGFFWKDPDGIIWEFNYVVTHTESEGPEYTESRIVGAVTSGDVVVFEQTPGKWTRVEESDWEALPSEMKNKFHAHFFGPVIRHKEDVVRLMPDPPSHEPVNVGESQTVSFQNKGGERLFTARMVYLPDDDEMWMLVQTWPLSGEAGTTIHVKYVDLLED